MEQQNLIAEARLVATQHPNANLATIDEKGFPHVRPMQTLSIDDDLTIYFATFRDFPKCRQIDANHNVCVSWSVNEDDAANWKHVIIKGTANVTDEATLRHRLWTEEMAQYFSAGKDDPNYVLIVIKPKELLFTRGEERPAKRVEF